MGFLSDLADRITGKSAQKTAQEAGSIVSGGFEQASDLLQDYGGQAIDAITGGVSGGRQDLLGGYGQAEGALKDYYGTAGDVLSDRFGSAAGIMGGGFDQARQDLISGAGSATGRLDPYLMGGQAAQEQLLAQMGLGGGEAVDVTQTPGFKKLMQGQQRVIEQQMAASGMLGSGVQMRDIAQSMGDLYTGDYLNRLQQLGQQGMQASGIASGIDMAKGQALAGLESSRGQALGGLEASLGQGLAGLQTGLGGNLSNLYGSRGQNLANLGMQGALNRSNLLYGMGGQLGSNAIQAAQQRAQALMGGEQAAQGAFGDMLGFVGGIAGSALGGPIGGAIKQKLLGSSPGAQRTGGLMGQWSNQPSSQFTSPYFTQQR